MKPASLQLGLVAAGCVLIALAALAGSPRAASGADGATVLRVAMSSDVDYVDPGLDYLSTGWEIQYATACKLLNYADKDGSQGSQLVPEVAGFPHISKDGKTYTFVVRKGFRFANGEPVTAQSFALAFNRDANPSFQSPAQAFIQDIIGANAVTRGLSRSIAGIAVRGDTISFSLVAPAPDFLSRLAMPFFQALPRSFARKVDPSGVNVIPSCGPYWIASRMPNKSIILKRNPYYRGSRPHNAAEIYYTIGNTQQVNEQDVLSGVVDYAADGFPPADAKMLAQKLGVNRGQFFIRLRLGLRYLALNHDRPLFKNNPQLAKALNYAVDRSAILQQAGFRAGEEIDHILPPALSGSRPCNCYSSTPDFSKAKDLAKGNTRSGTATLWIANRGSGPLQAQVIQYDLAKIGLDVNVQSFSRPVQIARESTRGAPFDLTLEGWVADYADPYDFINVLLSGDVIRKTNNNNVAYFDDPGYNRKMADAARLIGAKRYSTYASLDLEMMRDNPPWVPLYSVTDRILVAKRVGCFTFNPVFGTDLAALCPHA
ncbi:MAG TPA: ABC transporter substrate-binding protein [Gaiellaceae bacterium]|jgi:ABC-type oligopeptide transport system substrate-binding subunit